MSSLVPVVWVWLSTLFPVKCTHLELTQVHAQRNWSSVKDPVASVPSNGKTRSNSFTRRLKLQHTSSANNIASWRTSLGRNDRAFSDQCNGVENFWGSDWIYATQDDWLPRRHSHRMNTVRSSADDNDGCILQLQHNSQTQYHFNSIQLLHQQQL